MFACAITANVCYGLGILVRAYSWDVIYSSAPWILGSLGTVSLDIVIFAQVSHPMQWPDACRHIVVYTEQAIADDVAAVQVHILACTLLLQEGVAVTVGKRRRSHWCRHTYRQGSSCMQRTCTLQELHN